MYLPTPLQPQPGANPGLAAPSFVGGLISTKAALQAPAAGYTGDLSSAASMEVKPEQTVQGQIKAIIDADSPLMQQAETRGLQKANQRGLMNSSMAVGAGQAELYNVAAPIATSDAAAFNRAAEFNAGAEQQVNLANQSSTNTANQFNASSTNQVNSQNSQLQTNVALNNASLYADAAKFNASESNNLLKLGMDSQTKTELAQIEANYKTLMQSSQGAAEMYKQYMANASAIMTNKDMTLEAKNAAIRNQVSGLNNGLELMGKINNLNMGNLLTFDGSGAGAAPAAPAAGTGALTATSTATEINQQRALLGLAPLPTTFGGGFLAPLAPYVEPTHADRMMQMFPGWGGQSGDGAGVGDSF